MPIRQELPLCYPEGVVFLAFSGVGKRRTPAFMWRCTKPTLCPPFVYHFEEGYYLA